MLSVNDGATALVTYGYDAKGSRINKALNNGTVAVYAYDDADRMLSVDNTKAGASFSRFDYGYDNVNRRKFVQRDNGKGDVYTYDATDQVTDVKYEATNPDGSPGTPARTVSYSLDATGNRTGVTDNGSSTGYTPNTLNQYTGIGSKSLAYTANASLQSILMAFRQSFYFQAINKRKFG